MAPFESRPRPAGRGAAPGSFVSLSQSCPATKTARVGLGRRHALMHDSRPHRLDRGGCRHGRGRHSFLTCWIMRSVVPGRARRAQPGGWLPALALPSPAAGPKSSANPRVARRQAIPRRSDRMMARAAHRTRPTRRLRIQTLRPMAAISVMTPTLMIPGAPATGVRMMTRRDQRSSIWRPSPPARTRFV